MLTTQAKRPPQDNARKVKAIASLLLLALMGLLALSFLPTPAENPHAREPASSHNGTSQNSNSARLRHWTGPAAVPSTPNIMSPGEGDALSTQLTAENTGTPATVHGQTVSPSRQDTALSTAAERQTLSVPEFLKAVGADAGATHSQPIRAAWPNWLAWNQTLSQPANQSAKQSGILGSRPVDTDSEQIAAPPTPLPAQLATSGEPTQSREVLAATQPKPQSPRILPGTRLARGSDLSSTVQLITAQANPEPSLGPSLNPAGDGKLPAFRAQQATASSPLRNEPVVTFSPVVNLLQLAANEGPQLVPVTVQALPATESADQPSAPPVANQNSRQEAVEVGSGRLSQLEQSPSLEPLPRDGMLAKPGLIVSAPPEPSARTAMVDPQEPIPTPPGTPAGSANRAPPSATQTQTAKAQPQQGEAKQANPAVPSEKNMIGELIGSGYSLFSRMHDGGVYYSSELTLLSAENVGDARVGLTDLLNDDIYTNSADIGFGAGGRYTLGVRGSEVGLRAQYWHFEADAIDIDGGTWLNPSLRHTTHSRVRMESFDLEITQRYCLFGCRLESSFGGRYVDYEGLASALLTDELHESLELTGIARAMRSLNGAGPTLAIAGKKNIPFCFGGATAEALVPAMDCQSCNTSSCDGLCSTWRTAQPHFPLSVYWNGRISWLWADQISTAMTEASVMHQVNGTSVGTARGRDYAYLFDDSNTSLYTFTLQLGLEYSKPIFCRSQLTMRCGIEYQHWDLGEHLAQSQSFAFLTDDSTFGGRVDALATSRNDAIVLTGFTFSAGINY